MKDTLANVELRKLTDSITRDHLIHGLALLLLIIIVVPFILYAIPGAYGADGSYVVLSGSMEPEISPGDVILINQVEPASIEEGAIITFSPGEGESVVTHRVVDVIGEGDNVLFETQGDAIGEPDESLVEPGQLHGEVVLVIPYIGYVIQFINTPVGLVTMIILPFVLLLSLEAHTLLRSASTAGVDDQTQITRSEGQESETKAEEPTFALSKTDLALTTIVLFSFSIYSVWIVYHIQAWWSFAVTFGTIAMFVIGLSLYGISWYSTHGADSFIHRMWSQK